MRHSHTAFSSLFLRWGFEEERSVFNTLKCLAYNSLCFLTKLSSKSLSQENWQTLWVYLLGHATELTALMPILVQQGSLLTLQPPQLFQRQWGIEHLKKKKKKISILSKAFFPGTRKLKAKLSVLVWFLDNLLPSNNYIEFICALTV